MRIDLPSDDPKFSLCKHARKLIKEGHDPNTILHIYRRDTLCFRPMPLGKWADITTREGDGQSVKFIKYVPFPDL